MGESGWWVEWVRGDHLRKRERAKAAGGGDPPSAAGNAAGARVAAREQGRAGARAQALGGDGDELVGRDRKEKALAAEEGARLRRAKMAQGGLAVWKPPRQMMVVMVMCAAARARRAGGKAGPVGKEACEVRGGFPGTDALVDGRRDGCLR
ncbi:hypothetical protein BDY21DRAFT_217499 [Lineolata rhizophorae]|uniref:Uncharacterized protein n=1 Tax=Lineolata rhizophorae TaxID=578093 RepID=A0A6A6P3C6_9PEZI|nr:hypothetical protein BDY21DRAFT_217499 [Lineolata rhizophorae]